MKIANAISKCERAGFKVSQSSYNSSIYYASKDGARHYIGFHRNGGADCKDVAVIYVGDIKNPGDLQTDYFPETYCNSMAMAIYFAEKWQ